MFIRWRPRSERSNAVTECRWNSLGLLSIIKIHRNYPSPSWSKLFRHVIAIIFVYKWELLSEVMGNFRDNAIRPFIRHVIKRCFGSFLVQKRYTSSFFCVNRNIIIMAHGMQCARHPTFCAHLSAQPIFGRHKIVREIIYYAYYCAVSTVNRS